MNHPWFRDIDWRLLKNKKIQPPYLPVYRPEEYQEQLAAIQDAPVAPETLILLRKEAIQSRNIIIQTFFSSTITTE